MTQASRLASRATNIARAVSFAWFLRAGRGILQARDWTPSLDEYLAASRIPRDIVDQYLVPALAAAWGAPVSALGSFPAYDVLRVMQQGKASMPAFYDVPGGAATYVTALLADCTAVTLRLGTGVERLTREAEGWRVWTSDGTEQSFDQVVVATPAEVAGQLLRGADHPLADTVAGLKHFDTDIVVHRDFRLMPPERDAWSVINVRYDGHHAGRPNGPTATSPSTSSGPGCPPAIVCRWARSTGASFGT